VIQLGTFTGDPVEMRCRDAIRVIADIRPAEIVGNDDDNIGLLRRTDCCRLGQGQHGG